MLSFPPIHSSYVECRLKLNSPTRSGVSIADACGTRATQTAGLFLRSRRARSVLSGGQGRSLRLSARRPATAESGDRVGSADALAVPPARPARDFGRARPKCHAEGSFGLPTASSRVDSFPACTITRTADQSLR